MPQPQLTPPSDNSLSMFNSETIHPTTNDYFKLEQNQSITHDESENGEAEEVDEATLIDAAAIEAALSKTNVDEITVDRVSDDEPMIVEISNNLIESVVTESTAVESNGTATQAEEIALKTNGKNSISLNFLANSFDENLFIVVNENVTANGEVEDDKENNEDNLRKENNVFGSFVKLFDVLEDKTMSKYLLNLNQSLCTNDASVHSEDENTTNYTILTSYYPNVNAEMTIIDAQINKNCKLCSHQSKSGPAKLVCHYLRDHPESEVLISRMSQKFSDEIISNRKFPSIYADKRNRTVCPFCERNLVLSVAQWITHLTHHTGEYEYQCKKCKISLASKKHRSCRNALATKIIDYKIENSVFYAYICRLCCYTQLNKENILKHLRNEHQINDDFPEIFEQFEILRTANATNFKNEADELATEATIDQKLDNMDITTEPSNTPKHAESTPLSTEQMIQFLEAGSTPSAEENQNDAMDETMAPIDELKSNESNSLHKKENEANKKDDAVQVTPAKQLKTSGMCGKSFLRLNSSNFITICTCLSHFR